MGSRERRQREAAETRQRILDAARDLFVRRGYEATSMRAIADRIEYTPTAIYHHFLNKEALVSELVATDFRALAGVFQRLGRIDDPVERIERTGEAYVDFALSYPMHYRMMFMTERPNTAPADLRKGDPGEDAYAFLRETVAEAIEQGRFLPEYHDPDQVAQMLWSGMHGLVSLSMVKEHDPWVEFRDVRETAALARRAMLRGMVRPADG